MMTKSPRQVEIPASIVNFGLMMSLDDIVMALMGVTGAGKSTFIKRVTDRADIQIGHDLTSGKAIQAEAQVKETSEYSIKL